MPWQRNGAGRLSALAKSPAPNVSTSRLARDRGVSNSAACSCRLVRMLQDPRACSACGGTVDIMIIDKALDDGRTIPTKIGACLRCGKWFNEAGLLELTRLEPRQQEETAD